MSDYFESTLEFRSTGRARLDIHASFMVDSCIFDWNKDGNPIYKDGTFHQLNSDDETDLMDPESEYYKLQSVVLDGENLKITITDLGEDKELIFVKQ